MQHFLVLADGGGGLIEPIESPLALWASYQSL